MSVSVAEYLGQRVDIKDSPISPAQGENIKCPFMNSGCTKIKQHYKPICSVRQTDGSLWIVCRNRLCATKKKLPLTPYQVKVLFSVARCIFGAQVASQDIYVKREVAMPIVDGGHYSADFIMVVNPLKAPSTGQSRVVLEMQGGGETSNTGLLTNNVKLWESESPTSNSKLCEIVGKCGPIVTNAWRRQQEQFLVKGNIAQQTGGGIAFCVGSLLYDYLVGKLVNANLPNLKAHNWTLALIAFSEDTSLTPTPGPIPLIIDDNRVMFTNYISFTQALINQGNPAPAIFKGKFETLAGGTINIT